MQILDLRYSAGFFKEIKQSETFDSKSKYSSPAQKIDIDNKAHLRYQVGHWCRLIDASICGA